MPRVPKISVVPATQVPQDSALADPQKTTFGFLTKLPILFRYPAILVPKRTQWQNISDFKRFFIKTEEFKREGNVPFFVSKIIIISIKWNKIRGSHFEGLLRNSKKDQFFVLNLFQHLTESAR